MGSMCGMAVGDARGHPFEFMPATDTPSKAYFDLASMKFHREQNTFKLRRGQWTDDAAMGLCMADSLIMNRGFNNAFRNDDSRTESVGLGGNISKSLDAVEE